MEIGYLVLGFVQALAWPAVVIVLLLVLRNPISQAIRAITKLKYKDVELEFANGLQLAEASARELGLPAPAAARATTEIHLPVPSYDYLFDLARRYPRAGVTEAWRIVEMSLKTLGRSQGVDVRGARAERDVIHRMTDNDPMRSNLLELYERLRKLRNQAVHASETAITSEEAAGYVDLALGLASRLQSASTVPR